MSPELYVAGIIAVVLLLLFLFPRKTSECAPPERNYNLPYKHPHNVEARRRQVPGCGCDTCKCNGEDR